MGQDNRSVVLCGNTCSEDFVAKIKTALPASTFVVDQIEITDFSDTEYKIKIRDNVRGRRVFVIQSTSMPTENLMKLFMITYDALHSSAKEINLIIPYFSFARQDQKLESREPITASLVALLIQAAGANRVVCIDLHAGQIQGFFQKIPCDNLTAMPMFAAKIKQMFSQPEEEIKNICFVSPDVGGVKRVKKMSQIFGSPFAIFTKERDSKKADTLNGTGELIGDVEGKHCIIVDDLSSTMKSIILAAEKLKKSGAKTISFFCTHFACIPKVVEKIKSQINEIGFWKLITTNTHPNSKLALDLGFEVLDLSAFWAEVITRIENDQSLSELFEVKSF